MPLDPQKLKKASADNLRATLKAALTPEEYAQIRISEAASISGPPDIVAKARQALGLK